MEMKALIITTKNKEIMKKVFVVYSPLSKKYYYGDYGQIIKWTDEIYNSDFFDTKEDAIRFIERDSDGIYQIIEIYKAS